MGLNAIWNGGRQIKAFFVFSFFLLGFCISGTWDFLRYTSKTKFHNVD